MKNDEGGQKYDTIHNSTYYDPYISRGGDCCHKYWRQRIPRDIWRLGGMYCDFSVYYETLNRTKEKVKKVEDPTGSSTFSRIKRSL